MNKKLLLLDKMLKSNSYLHESFYNYYFEENFISMKINIIYKEPFYGNIYSVGLYTIRVNKNLIKNFKNVIIK